MKNHFKLGKICIHISSVFFIAYNYYFGWNTTPESKLEESFDDCFQFMYILSILFLIFPIVELIAKKVNEELNKY